MRLTFRTKTNFAFIALCLALIIAQAPCASAQEPAPSPKSKMGQRGGPNPFQMDPRAQDRTYHFDDTNADLHYCLFGSSKVSKDKKAPLIVSLHGLGAGPSIMVNKDAVDLAEAGGYILLAPMGFNERGWYGIPMGNFGKTPPKAAPKPEGPQTGNEPAPKPKASMFFNANDPPNLRELSEKDVMNVLDIVRKEFKVDENRIYLMGHSMGGAGTLHLGIKYGSIWAALAPVAPAAFGIDPSGVEKIKNMPIIFVHGDVDEAVPVSVSRQWVDKMKELGMTYEYNEMKGVSHGPVITASLPSVYEFFSKHSKSESK